MAHSTTERAKALNLMAREKHKTCTIDAADDSVGGEVNAGTRRRQAGDRHLLVLSR